MSKELIPQMLDADQIDHGHYVYGKIHTDNSMKLNFIYDYKVADIINLKLYRAVSDLTAIENIVAIDPVSTMLAFPISLMCKLNLFTPGNTTGTDIDGKCVMLASVLYDVFAVNQAIELKDLSVTAIVCVTNYSGMESFEGIPIIELIPVNTWNESDCPYCKDKE